VNATDWAELAAADIDTVWLLSYTEDASDRVSTAIAGLADEVGRPLRIERAAVSSVDPDRARLPDTVQRGRLVAAILVLEPEGVDDRRLDEVGRWIATQAMDDPGFRVFVYLDRLTYEGVRELARQGHRLFTDLVDTIQIDTEDPLRERLSQHLGGVRAQRTARAFRHLEVAALMLVGRAAFFVELVCVVASVVTASLLYLSDLAVGGFVPPTALSLVLGASVFPLLSGPLYVILHGTSGLRLLEGRPLNVALLGLAATLSIATLYVCDTYGAGWSWTALGLAVGVLLEAVRRGRRQARRQLVSPARILQSPPDLRTLYDLTHAAFSIPDPWRCPLVPLPGIDVFLSYAHASPWGSETAHEFRDVLAAEGVKTFLDRRDIAAGSAWRGTLAESIGDTGVFVAALDPESMRRDWVAAEVTAALVGRVTGSLPHVVFITDREPGEFPPDDRRHPIFSILLERIEAGGPEAPTCRVVSKVDDASQMPDLNARTLVARHALLPPLLVLPVLLAVLIVALPAFLAVPAGVAGWLLGSLQIWERYDAATMLAQKGVLEATYIACGFLLGFGLRSRVLARMHKSVPVFNVPMDFLALAGFLVALVAWYPYVSALTVGWSIAACPCGLVVAAIFFHGARDRGR